MTTSDAHHTCRCAGYLGRRARLQYRRTEDEEGERVFASGERAEPPLRPHRRGG